MKLLVNFAVHIVVWTTVNAFPIRQNIRLLAFAGFPFPIALTMWHMGFCSAVGFLCIRVLGISKSHNLSMDEYSRRVLPIGMLYAASLWLSNSSYLYLSVSFIQMTKSLMPGLVYACGVALGVEQYSTSSALNMVLIAAGVGVCALGEQNLVLKGLIQQLAALLFEVSNANTFGRLCPCFGRDCAFSHETGLMASMARSIYCFT